MAKHFTEKHGQISTSPCTTPGPNDAVVPNTTMGVETLDVESGTTTPASKCPTETSTATPQSGAQTPTPKPQSSSPRSTCLGVQVGRRKTPYHIFQQISQISTNSTNFTKFDDEISQKSETVKFLNPNCIGNHGGLDVEFLSYFSVMSPLGSRYAARHSTHFEISYPPPMARHGTRFEIP